jgi:RNA polymerase sigma-70 factor (ECF subfamily)
VSPPVPAPPDFDAIFRAHAGFVWRVLQRHGLPARELPDGCQEVFMVVHRRLPEFEGRSSLRTWIYAIAQRVAQGMRKKRDLSHGELHDESHVGGTAAQDDELQQKQQLALIERALRELPEDKREVFALYELEGMTMAEVARALEIPENTALYRLYGARDFIRAAIARRARPVPQLRMMTGAKR